MSSDLFHIPETPVPPLEAARQRLAKAVEAEREADQIFENQGPDAMPALFYARETRRITERVVEALEREAMRGAKA